MNADERRSYDVQRREPPMDADRRRSTSLSPVQRFSFTRSLQRRVEPEWLDELPANDPRAVRSRRDLRLMNRIMGHARIVRGALDRTIPRDSPLIAELGAGDGTLLERALPKRHRNQARIVFVDRQPVVSTATIEAYRRQGCDAAVEAADVFAWLEKRRETFDAIVANLFVHHFDDDQLARLFALASRRTRAFVACEPRRARVPLAGSLMLGVIGCNDVTRHDAHLSVRAGFAGGELSALWPAGEGWRVEERRAGMFSHLFVAVR
jgi:hypothetical protein